MRDIAAVLLWLALVISILLINSFTIVICVTEQKAVFCYVSVVYGGGMCANSRIRLHRRKNANETDL